jgi:hypothetical protein
LSVALVLLTSCTRSFTSSETPGSLLDPSQPRSVSASIRITAAGVSPPVLHLDHPVTVTFTNDDTATHRLEPAPELGYGTCSEMNALGALEPGQTGRVTIERGGVVCTFHDSAGPANQAFQGFVVVH